MPVIVDGLWWTINWPWMLLWLATAAAGLSLLTLWIGGKKPLRKPSIDLVNKRCVYLDDHQIMDKYKMHRYAVALRQEVEQRDKYSGAVKLVWRLLPFVSPEANLEASREVVTKFIQEEEAISVIGMIVDGLERGDALLHVDLRDLTVEHSAALRKLPATSGSHGRALPLSITTSLFVLLTGDFTSEPDVSAAEHSVLTGALGPGGRIRITCSRNGFRTEDQDKLTLRPGFCLGKVQSWLPEEELLDVRAMAIFS